MKMYKLIAAAVIILLSCGSEPIDPNSKLYKRIQHGLDEGDPFEWKKLRWYSDLSFSDVVADGDTVWASDSCVFVTFHGRGGYEVSKSWDEDCERLKSRSILPPDTLCFHRGDGTTDSIFIDSSGVKENEEI